MTKLVLIGGTSHTGKSTLARAVALKLGLEVVSSDTFGRHPGRPWPLSKIPPHVAEHYHTLSPEALVADVLAYYDTRWPQIEQHIARGNLVLEGSALWPARLAGVKHSDTAMVWLTAGDDFLKDRIERESNYASADVDQKQLIESFIARTQLFNRRMMDVVRAHDLPFIDVERESGDLVAAVLRTSR